MLDIKAAIDSLITTEKSKAIYTLHIYTNYLYKAFSFYLVWEHTRFFRCSLANDIHIEREKSAFCSFHAE